MKKTIIAIALFTAGAGLLFTGCKKEDFDKNYYNPETSVTANIPSLYAGLFSNDIVSPHYWDLYTFRIPMIGVYSQTSGYSNGSKIYEQAVNYTQDRWNDYYTNTLSRYRELEKYYDNLTSDEEKQGFRVFLETGRIFVYDQTAQMVDFWGDIPFSNAGQLNSKGSIILASYDKGADVYQFILSDLKRISGYLDTVQVDAFYQNQFQSYDFVNKGDITRWRKYCNSLMLRLAMRISYQDETAAKSLVQTILGNPADYPLIDQVSDNETIQPTSTASNLLTVNDIRNGFGINPFAPGKMVDSVMVPANDPRLAVFFTRNKNGEFHGVPNSWTANRVTDSITANYFSRYDSTTFTEDNLFPGIIMTASEVSFLKAEAFTRWGGGSAATAYEDGIKQSIQFYYAVNQHSDYTGGHKPAMPSDGVINTFLNQPKIALTGNKEADLEKIATEKWIDFNVMQANQAWAEWRRTGYPYLNFPADPSSVLSPNVPNRLLYPGTEASLNAENYDKVKSEDNVAAKVFWDVR